MYASLCTNIHTYTWACDLCVDICIFACMWACRRIDLLSKGFCAFACVYVCVCVYENMHILCVNILTYIRAHGHAGGLTSCGRFSCICVYVCVCMCMRICMFYV
jgi:hypothetical protein